MRLRLLATSLLLLLAWRSLAAVQPTTVGVFEHHQDVGAVATPGSVVYDTNKLTYTIKAAGTNMWASKDEFHYAWKRMKGNFILRARAAFSGKGVDPHRKIGWIIHSTLDTDAPHVNASLHGDGLTSLQWRRAKGAITEQLPFTEKNFEVVQLEGRGGKYIMSRASARRSSAKKFPTCLSVMRFMPGCMSARTTTTWPKPPSSATLKSL